MDKYYLISGKALANVQFRCSGNWYTSGQPFANERISERDLKRYARFLNVYEDSKREVVDIPNTEVKDSTSNAPRVAFINSKEKKQA